MMGTVRHIDFYPDEYIVGASRLTFEEQGVYWMVCSLISSNAGPIEADYKWIGGLGRMGAAKARNIVKNLIFSGKLTENGGKISQKRAENEVKNAQKRIETSQKNGANGGRPPKEINGLENPVGLSTEKLTTNYQLSTTTIKKDTPPRKRDESTSVPCEFDNFWLAYPRKSGKGAAKKAFVKAVKLKSPSDLVTCAEEYAAACIDAGIDRQYVPHPATWLNQERWDDDPPPAGGSDPVLESDLEWIARKRFETEEAVRLMDAEQEAGNAI